MAEITNPLIVYIPDTRGVLVSRYGKGNLKIGLGVYTYSRLPGHPRRAALGATRAQLEVGAQDFAGTCPGASQECQAICYAARPVTEDGAVARMWDINSQTSDVPSIPADATILRLHISGDFDTVAYIENWITRLTERPDVTCWAYTRSWRVPVLLPVLEQLRALPNVQLFASMDQSIPEVPPVGWRRAWIDGDVRAGQPVDLPAHKADSSPRNIATYDGTFSLVCPEETKHKTNCQDCRYCFDGKQNDVTFLRH